MALVAGLAAPALGTLTGGNVREAAGALSGAFRALFDTAALRHATCRMALDLDKRQWWAECAPGPVGVARDERDAADAEELARLFPDEKDEESRRLLAKTTFGAFSDRLVQPTALPGRAAFGKVAVEGRDAATDGIVYVHFFPGGQAQRAFVPVVDGDHLFTVVLEPFTGRSRVVAGPVEVRQ